MIYHGVVALIYSKGKINTAKEYWPHVHFSDSESQACRWFIQTIDLVRLTLPLRSTASRGSRGALIATPSLLPVIDTTGILVQPGRISHGAMSQGFSGEVDNVKGSARMTPQELPAPAIKAIAAASEHEKHGKNNQNDGES